VAEECGDEKKDGSGVEVETGDGKGRKEGEKRTGSEMGVWKGSTEVNSPQVETATGGGRKVQGSGGRKARDV